MKAVFELRISAIRKKIFDYFDEKGYMIPWVEWNMEEGTDRYGNPIHMTDEDKMEYLKVYGCVYPKGANLNDKDISYLMLKTDALELEKVYDQIINERNEAIDKLIKQITISPRQDESVVLNKRQDILDNVTDLSYLKYKNSFNGDQLVSDLKDLDMHYGSVLNKYFEDSKLEHDYLQTLITVCNLKTENNVPTRDEWIRLFQNISNEILQEADNRLAKEFGWEKEESEGVIKDYLQSVRPVVKDLKETPDSVFIRIYAGESEVEPSSAELVLMERAKKHTVKYKGQLQPVL